MILGFLYKHTRKSPAPGGMRARACTLALAALALGLLAGCATPAPAPTLEQQYQGWPLKPYPVAGSVERGAWEQGDRL